MTTDTICNAETPDPPDWDQSRALAHRMVDDAIDHLRDVRDRPVWQAVPDPARAAFSTPLPLQPQPLDDIYEEVAANLIPYPMGNVPPRFWMLYMGAGNFTGALADFLAAIDGSNLGAGNTAASLVDRQTTDWIRTMMGFPRTASGTLVNGGSMANIVGLMAARNHMAGVDLRQMGVAAMPQPLRFYASDQVHACHDKAMNLLGLGRQSLCRVPSDDASGLRNCDGRDDKHRVD